MPQRNALRRVLTLAALATLTCLASSCRKDPNAPYRNIQLTKGMAIAVVKESLGEPDSYDDRYCDHFLSAHFSSRTRDAKYRYYMQELGYGPFGAHNQRVGHITKYRLKMTFIDGRLHEWSRSAPAQEE
jgi:hypothetical protein